MILENGTDGLYRNVDNYESAPRNVQEERIPHLHCGWSLQSLAKRCALKIIPVCHIWGLDIGEDKLWSSDMIPLVFFFFGIASLADLVAFCIAHCSSNVTAYRHLKRKYLDVSVELLKTTTKRLPHNQCFGRSPSFRLTNKKMYIYIYIYYFVPV